MKRIFYSLVFATLAGGMTACGGGAKNNNAAQEETAATTQMISYSKLLKAPETDSLSLPVDKDGYITIFDGKTFNGWRGYGKDRVPSKWTIEDGCIKSPPSPS